MHLEHILQAHGLTKDGGSGTNVELPNIENFIATSSPNGDNIKLTWANSTYSNFLRSEIYVSTENITNANLDYVKLNATKIVTSDTLTEFIYSPVTLGQTYYFKSFAIYDMFGVEDNSKGVGVTCAVADTQPPSKVTDISIKEDNTKLTVNYTPPLDADYMGTRLVYNTTADPTGINDGTVIANFISGTDITGLLNDTKYFIRLFPYDMSGNYNTETGQSVVATPTEMKIYGVKIEKANSNPETSVTYTDNAIGLTPMKSTSGVFNIGSWGDKFPFNAIKPCLVKNGVVNYYLNPNDYTKKATGGASDITTGTDGDVMVEFPKIYWKMSEDSTHRHIQYSDKPFTGAKCLAHMRGVTEKDKCYISAYLGFETGGKLRSLSGKTPTVSKTIGAFRTIAQANGVGYDQMAYYQLLMLQVLYTVAFKNLDSQTALGRGYVNGNSASIATGGTNTKGMFYGETTGKQQMKFCGIEDFYGNVRCWIDGFFYAASRNILIANQNFNDTGSGYTNYGQGATANLGGYISDIQGGTETGFVAKAVGGSETTYYADYGFLKAGCLPYFGGVWADAARAGAFCFYCSYSAADAFSSIGARCFACV